MSSVRVARTSSTAHRLSSGSTYTSSTAANTLASSLDPDDRSEAVERVTVELRVDDRDLLVERRIAERRPDQEPVELRLRQWERPLLLDRVLRREQQERVRERVRDAVDRHLPLGHRLEQRGLRLRQGPVDLVDEEDVGEHRTGLELEPSLAPDSRPTAP